MLNEEDINFYLGAFKELELTDIAELSALGQSRQLRAGEVYIKEGSLQSKLSYIKQGLIRAYYPKENGDEVTVMLRWESQFMAPVDSVIYQKPSRFIYQALEDTELIEFDYQKAQDIIDHNLKLSSTRNLFILDMLAEAMARIETFLLLSPEERYLNLIKEKPDIFNRVNNKHLATFLGITPVSLSRIRKRISSPRKRN
ncbi:Crp/Fnr family transcriptional regulator [Mucilaginibacter paludis]|uniref:Transcriptional regulator, Crp/Fnr family n=1 Tax=Mucilaginibacter paludis DSM 18603 TaxID=714943 RepID=H1Y8G8_9SPHI|nr:Crp/Fnr family transcriptional regulator [Mucilaginibacter paludis]EHQ25886.1 putative transcriptional regulator, Crp/Fnr family [Mucilaginibacter paludis DSM 18603]